MDASLSTLANCEKLSLSTNCIEKIANLNGLKNLRILSLGRNNIKNLNGLEAVGDTLEELWISYNFIEKLKGIHVMKKLKILYMSNNLVKDWAEFVKLAELPCLEDLVFVGNPLEEKHSAEGNWIDEATKRVPKLKKLDDQQHRLRCRPPLETANPRLCPGMDHTTCPLKCTRQSFQQQRDLLSVLSCLVLGGASILKVYFQVCKGSCPYNSKAQKHLCPHGLGRQHADGKCSY
nr:dynein axonemal light chain 1 isoform X2 [Myodes glareolus]